MNGMVERVARALCWRSCLSSSHGEPGDFDRRWIDANWPRYAETARAAIEAMKAVENCAAPSTNAMTRAFDLAYREASKHHGHLESWNVGWIAAIDAALNSPSNGDAA